MGENLGSIQEWVDKHTVSLSVKKMQLFADGLVTALSSMGIDNMTENQQQVREIIEVALRSALDNTGIKQGEIPQHVLDATRTSIIYDIVAAYKQFKVSQEEKIQ